MRVRVRVRVRVGDCGCTLARNAAPSGDRRTASDSLGPAEKRGEGINYSERTNKDGKRATKTKVVASYSDVEKRKGSDEGGRWSLQNDAGGRGLFGLGGLRGLLDGLASGPRRPGSPCPPRTKIDSKRRKILPISAPYGCGADIADIAELLVGVFASLLMDAVRARLCTLLCSRETKGPVLATGLQLHLATAAIEKHTRAAACSRWLRFGEADSYIRSGVGSGGTTGWLASHRRRHCSLQQTRRARAQQQCTACHACSGAGAASRWGLRRASSAVANLSPIDAKLAGLLSVIRIAQKSFSVHGR